MKALRILGMMLLTPAVLNVALAQSKLPVIGEYLPKDKTLAPALIMQMQLDETSKPYMEKIDKGFAELNAEDKKNILEKVKPSYPIPYDARLKISEEDHKKYLETWDLRKIVDVGQMVVSLDPVEGNPDEWKLTVLTAQGQPTPFCGFTYNAKTNEWTTPTGVMKFKGDVNHDKNYVYGPWSGKEWTLEKKGFSNINETLLLGISEDKKFHYFLYSIQEVNPELNAVLVNETIALRIPIATEDPLRNKAKQEAKKGSKK